MTLGEKIQQLRKVSGISQEQLAEQLDVSRQSVSKWELNESVPDIKKLILLSDLFSVSIDELLKDSPPAPASNNDSKSPATLIEIAQLNRDNSQIAMGFRTIIIGLILFVLEFMFLPVFGAMHKEHVAGQGFYIDYILYAKVQPMPVIFTITGILVLVGVFLIVKGTIGKKIRHVK